MKKIFQTSEILKRENSVREIISLKFSISIISICFQFVMKKVFEKIFMNFFGGFLVWCFCFGFCSFKVHLFHFWEPAFIRKLCLLRSLMGATQVIKRSYKNSGLELNKKFILFTREEKRFRWNFLNSEIFYSCQKIVISSYRTFFNLIFKKTW